MRVSRNKQNITSIPFDPSLLVHTAWDIGYNDDTAIIFLTLGIGFPFICVTFSGVLIIKLTFTAAFSYA